MNLSSEKLTKLRALMHKHKLAFYLVLGTDPHQTEYTPAIWRRRAFISGFTGSNGDALIGLDQAYLWTDGRYTLQAKLELDPQLFTLFEYQQGQASTLTDFLVTHAKGKRVGVDPSTLTYLNAEKLKTALAAIDAELVFLPNLVDLIWEDRPTFHSAPAFVYPLQYAGIAAPDKLTSLRAFMQEQGLQYVALNELASIAWLFNIRGRDAQDSPLIFSYALISLDAAQLYLNEPAVTTELKEYCAQHHIGLMPYEDFYKDLGKLKKVTVGFDLDANALMHDALKRSQARSLKLPMMLAKAIKNETELQGMINAHIEDAVALVRFFTWLNQHWQGQNEISASDKLQEFRQQSPLFFSLSFPTIAGFKDHGAIIHYRAKAETAYALGNDGLFLVDSGGQYWGGTTDVTRTIHLGTPTDFEKACYTLVLKGHLALRHTPFPHGTRGEQLDGLARQYLWHKGFNYAHGTGHGVGAFLNVHEGPQRISTGATTTPLLPNMITSNEPGVYFEGKFGIRIENLCYVKEADLAGFYILEDLTLVPYCRKLIDVGLLTSEEIRWVNEYHRRVYEVLASRVDEAAKSWLKAETQPW